MSNGQPGDRQFDIQWSGDVVVVGAGIVGLAAAREILRRNPATRLAVLDKEDEIARHQTGHNSGVIHSGIYYKPGSFKARACVAGAALMMQFCEEREIPFKRCGKVIIATEEEELPRLYDLHERGQQNGCPDIRIIESDELKEIEPHATGVKALLSPNTGIVDYRQVAFVHSSGVMIQKDALTLYRVLEACDRSSAYPLEEISDFLRSAPDKLSNVRTTLSYFDPIHHVPAIRATTLIEINDTGAIGGPEWVQPLSQAFEGQLEYYQLTHEGGTDQDQVDRWLAEQLYSSHMPRFQQDISRLDF